jgi:DNA invertase Pin-like site-specific DNA recombinase
MTLSKPFATRNPSGVLRVIIPGRVSTPGQDTESIASQQEDAERWLRRVHPGPVRVTRLGEQASGWLADRKSMIEARRLIESGEVDAVVATELRELYRNPALHWRFVYECIDHDVRVILINDGVDTATENWEVMMHTASLRHGMTVPETRRRVRHKATYTFGRGGMVLKLKYGYRKLTAEQAQSGQFGPVGLRIAKRPECTAVIREIRDRVVRGDSYVRIADWLNMKGSPPAPTSKAVRAWTGRVVKDLLRDPILSGRRRFRATVCRMVYKTGRHRVERNPDKPEEKEYPELAHLTSEEHAEVLGVMEARKEESKVGQGQPAVASPPVPVLMARPTRPVRRVRWADVPLRDVPPVPEYPGSRPSALLAQDPDRLPRTPNQGAPTCGHLGRASWAAA